jgi:hypothetical protein
MAAQLNINYTSTVSLDLDEVIQELGLEHAGKIRNLRAQGNVLFVTTTKDEELMYEFDPAMIASAEMDDQNPEVRVKAYS